MSNIPILEYSIRWTDSISPYEGLPADLQMKPHVLTSDNLQDTLLLFHFPIN